MDDVLAFTVADIGVKYRIKCEVYTVLGSEGGIFLPAISDVSKKFLRVIIIDDKNYVKCSEEKQTEFLIWKDSMSNTSNNEWEKGLTLSLYSRLRIVKRANREWFVNFVSTLLKEEFLIAINDKWRDVSRIKKGNLGIMASEEFVEIFKNSKPISISKEKTYFLTRRLKERIMGVKEPSCETESESEMREVDRLKGKLEELSTKIQRDEQDD